MRGTAAALATMLLARAAWAAPVPGDGPSPLPESGTAPAELQNVGIDEKPGAQLPADAAFLDQNGRKVAIGQYFDGKRPVVFVLAYYTCPMLCTLVLNGVNEAAKELPWDMGKGYRVVAASIDPRDTPALAAEKRANYVKAHGRPVTDDGWDFLVGEEAQVRRVADAVGFRYAWDERSQQYAHAAGVFVFTPDGKLSRVLYGVGFPANDVRLALAEAGRGRITSAWDRVLLYCFHYDPAARGYALSAMRVMQLGGGAVAVGLAAGVLFLFLKRDRTAARRRAPTGGNGP